jgi:hypothetical protein
VRRANCKHVVTIDAGDANQGPKWKFSERDVDFKDLLIDFYQRDHVRAQNLTREEMNFVEPLVRQSLSKRKISEL